MTKAHFDYKYCVLSQFRHIIFYNTVKEPIFTKEAGGNMKKTMTLAMIALSGALVSAQPSITTKIATKDVASVGAVFSETPVLKTKVALDGTNGYVSFEQVRQLNSPSKFFYDYAAMGTSYDTTHANFAAEVSSVNVAGFGRINELWTKATLKAPLSPSLEYACDVGAESGHTFAASVSSSRQVGETTIGLEAAIGYNHHLSTDSSAFSHTRLDVTVSRPITQKLSVSAMARLQKSLHAMTKDAQMYQLSAMYKF